MVPSQPRAAAAGGRWAASGSRRPVSAAAARAAHPAASPSRAALARAETALLCSPRCPPSAGPRPRLPEAGLGGGDRGGRAGRPAATARGWRPGGGLRRGVEDGPAGGPALLAPRLRATPSPPPTTRTSRAPARSEKVNEKFHLSNPRTDPPRPARCGPGRGGRDYFRRRRRRPDRRADCGPEHRRPHPALRPRTIESPRHGCVPGGHGPGRQSPGRDRGRAAIGVLGGTLRGARLCLRPHTGPRPPRRVLPAPGDRPPRGPGPGSERRRDGRGRFGPLPPGEPASPSPVRPQRTPCRPPGRGPGGPLSGRRRRGEPGGGKGAACLRRPVPRGEPGPSADARSPGRAPAGRREAASDVEPGL
ncbi:translation initiation factor IF-2-like [Pipistrellus kuhlii]|uniref:translation initiation factor IF-2-like n=1 Tax=Pipistrellus kuhlii TaxID=59472 RepID=UPI001E26FD14|nr:translation initiation factor IF-2-like [Pipistrellus kuhlii]